jgi:membrane protein DedA with SNARE-associated domain
VSALAAQGGGGIFQFVLDVVNALGEVGVGAMILLETVFPPIPSEAILPLAGYNAYQGDMNVWLALVAATVGATLGALVLYYLGRFVGEQRTVTALSKLPLVGREDFEKASAWFHRHGRSAVFFGRLIPVVRSLISLPAGAQRMPLPTFLLFTALGSGFWNALLIGIGYALGTQYELVEEYSQFLDYAVYTAFAAVAIALVVRAIRRHRAGLRMSD